MATTCPRRYQATDTLTRVFLISIPSSSQEDDAALPSNLLPLLAAPNWVGPWFVAL
jgi:hypothetical protein